VTSAVVTLVSTRRLRHSMPSGPTPRSA
jgi:hypothetical protein